MADDKSRAYRSRDPVADVDSVAREVASDPLAELARLIGQSDPVGEFGGNSWQRPAPTLGDGPAAAADDSRAADDEYAEPDHYADSRDAPPRFSDPYAATRNYPAEDRDYEREPSEADPYSEEAPNFDPRRDYGTAGDPQYREEEFQPAASGRQLAALAPQSPDTAYQAEDQWQVGADGQSYDANGQSYDVEEQSYDVEEYDDEFPGRTRRSGLIVVVAVLGLATVGVAGAFAYRTMFGGSMLPSLPPIIKATEGPNKIVPSHSDQADASSQPGGGEKVVSREEQPVNIQTPPDTAPRVISTIPIMPGAAAGQGAPLAPAASPPAAASVAQAPPAPAPPATVAAAPTAAPAPPAASPQVAASTAPKKIHTVVIRADQSGATADATAAQAPPATQLAQAAPAPVAAVAPPAKTVSTRPAPPSRPATPQGGGNAPLSIIPQQDEGASPPPAPAPSRVARAEAPDAPLAIGSATSPSPAGGGYSVQVTSQRSQQEAQAEFRSLQAKYPNQLAGREPIIRRADLGDKGTYYRALVGPFASMEDAAAMCSNLKSAGGTCIVQRN